MSITWMQLRDAREKAGLTQAELARRVGVHAKTITNWEKVGSTVPRNGEYKVRRALAGIGTEPDPQSHPELGSTLDAAPASRWYQRDVLALFSDEELLEEIQLRITLRKRD